MRPVPVFPDYLVKLVIPPSRAILKPAVIYRFVSLFFWLIILDPSTSKFDKKKEDQKH